MTEMKFIKYLIIAVIAVTFVTDANFTEGPRLSIEDPQEFRFLQDEPYEIAAIALGYPMQSSSDWNAGSTGPRAIMTKELKYRTYNIEPPYFMHWCSGFADQY